MEINETRIPRDYTKFNSSYEKLLKDVYPQPADDGHNAWTDHIIMQFYELGHTPKSVLDVGCGSGHSRILFEINKSVWVGITLSEDDALSRPDIFQYDMSFLPFEEDSYDLIFARHSLEHSPFPLLTLMEWYRVSKKHLLLVVPTPEFWGVHGKNHYSVMYRDQLEWLLARAGWKIVWSYDFTTDSSVFQAHADWESETRIVEYRYLLEKGKPITV